MSVSELKQIPNNVCNRNQSLNALQRHSIHITDSDNDFILDEIKRWYTIEYEIDMSVYDEEYYFK